MPQLPAREPEHHALPGTSRTSGSWRRKQSKLKIKEEQEERARHLAVREEARDTDLTAHEESLAARPWLCSEKTLPEQRSKAVALVGISDVASPGMRKVLLQLLRATRHDATGQYGYSADAKRWVRASDLARHLDADGDGLVILAEHSSRMEVAGAEVAAGSPEDQTIHFTDRLKFEQK
jgi:hypothetical protein